MGNEDAIKNELIDEIWRLDDIPFLEGILAMVKQCSLKSPRPVYQLTKEENDALESAMRSMDEGNFVTHEDANAEIEIWLEH